ncbi:MAG: aminoglycoside phosphotransferase family protein [Anaerolineae bacterium]|nr:aminoglycoside phosphotransferase family protein [Anaerolineae bacterium]
MLERTLSTDFVPGSNQRGAVAGANWAFLLPDLALGTVLWLGTPSPGALRTVAALAGRVIVCGDHEALDALTRIENSAAISFVPFASGEALPCPAASADLVILAGHQARQRVGASAALQAEIARVLAPSGAVYYETWTLGSSRQARPLLKTLHMAGRFWLTPLGGTMHTAVPADDRITRRTFVQRALFSPAITIHSLKRMSRRIRQRTEKGSAGAPEPSSEDVHPGGGGLLRRASTRALSTLAATEGRLLQRAWGVQRTGTLLTASADRLDGDPPAYLRALAREAGLDLDGYRWGLWAGGQYSSRKLLFFLFEGDDPSPRHLVKMVRAAIFNARLENEARALTLLQALTFSRDYPLPQVTFAGHAGGLALVGQTIIEGAPFLQRTTLRADCPLARAAIDWLTALGVATADPRPVTPAAAAGVLETLFARFQAIYHLPAVERDFLAGQIARLGEAAGDFPLVFQHGDPGPWNMLATPDGRVALLDWESAEPQGVPLWDLFYFLRSFVVNAARAESAADRETGFARHLFAGTELGRLVVEATRAYCAQVQIPTQLVEPLYYTCWMHRALKQSTLLDPARLAQGPYVRLLVRSIAERDAPTLRALFSLR